MHAPFTWECVPRGIVVALCGTNQIEATMLRVHSTYEKAVLFRIRLLKLKVRQG